MLDGISGNMAALVETGKYGAINKTDTTKMGYYVIKFLSEDYTWQEGSTCDGQIRTSAEISIKSQYMDYIKDNTKWY